MHICACYTSHPDVCASLRPPSSQVLLLAGSYLLATECLDVMQHVGAIDDLNSTEKLFLVLPVAVLDAIFILWIFTALSKTLALLQVKQGEGRRRG